MGEQRDRRRRHDDLLRNARCTYCVEPATTIEHMPPIWLFQDRSRLKGLEFAACYSCNHETRGADFTVGFLARLKPFGGTSDPLFAEAAKRRNTLDQLVPGLREELFDSSDRDEILVKGPTGNYELITRIQASGPLLATELIRFGAKLGMALYREHIGKALPNGGAVFVQPYLNAGLPPEAAEPILRILPGWNTLKQGRKDHTDQFGYRYNSDNQSIMMALASFQGNIHFMVLATSTPATYRDAMKDFACAEVSLGGLLSIRADTFLPPRAQGTAST